jgi:hypothetical protein
VLIIDDEIGINVAPFLEGIVDLSAVSFPSTDWETYVCCDDLLIPSLSGEFPVSKKGATDLAVGTIAANNIRSLVRNFPLGGLASDLGNIFILGNRNDFMGPVNGCAGLLGEVLNEDLSKLIQRQAHHAVGMVRDRLHADSSEPRSVEFPPADTVWGKPAGTNVVNDASLDQFLDGGGGVVSCSGLSIQFVAHINEIDFDSFLCESETEEKS